MIIPDGFGQVNFRYIGTGMPTGAEVTLGFNIDAGAPVLPVDQAAFFKGVWNTRIKPLTTTVCTLKEVYVKNGPNATGPDGTSTANIVGTLGDSPATPNMALLVRKNTAGGGRRGRGRLYWPGLPESYLDQAGNILAAAITSWQTAMTGLFDDAAASFLPLVLLHAPGATTTPEPTPLTSLSVQSVAATQRLRMRR
jgi:hypothetical protein